MDDKFSELFDNWPSYMHKMGGLYERLGILLTDLGIAKNEVRIIAFINSVLRGEIRFYDSHGTSCSAGQCLKANEKYLLEEQLIELFNVKREQSLFTVDSRSTHFETYDEFGAIPRGHEEVYAYGVIIQYNQLESSKIIFELLNQISFYYKNVLDDKKFEIEEYMLDNLVYIALKKQIDIDFYNTLAAVHYEKKAASGGILLVNEIQEYNLKLHFEEKYPLEIKNVKQIRKLLEMTTDEFFLISKDGNVLGIGDYEYLNSDCELFLFNGHQVWSYYKSGKELLSYKEGKYTFIFDYNQNYISHFPKNFITKRNHEYLNSILHEIRQQKHGTLLIITDDAKYEVERLCKFGRGYAIKSIDLTMPGSRNLLQNITSIDGAIFIDTNLVCYGVGVILDGIAVKSGLSSRGARYNSAQCYIDNKDYEKFVAVVFSDDDTIDILYNKEKIA